MQRQDSASLDGTGLTSVSALRGVKEWIHGLSAQIKAEAAVLKAAGSAKPGLALPPGAKNFPFKPPENCEPNERKGF